MSIAPSVPHVLDTTGSFQPMPLLDPTSEQVGSLAADRYQEDQDAVRILMAVPGLDTDKTRVAVENGNLRVSGDREAVSADGTAATSEHFEKTVSLNKDDLDVQNMEARLYDKTLVVGIPKKGSTTA